MSIELFFRLVGMVTLAVGGWQLGSVLAGDQPGDYIRYVFVLSLAGAALGLLITPWITVRPIIYVRDRIRKMPIQRLIAMVIGLVVGLIIAALLALPVSMLPAPAGQIFPFIATLIFGWLGISIAVMRQEDLFTLWGGRGRGGGRIASEGRGILLDTSVIIDGRIADISRTGFIRESLLIPRFVLNELQHIADSADALRRNRGRRGLEILNRLRSDSSVPIRILNHDVEDAYEVDDKLVLLAKELRCPILTNDYNLNRVAELQGVTVLNINDLANAVKSIYLPGESLTVHLIQEGREPGQGVGYLDDGTMVVVENGKNLIGQTIETEVTKVLQTSAGRMIFARPR